MASLTTDIELVAIPRDTTFKTDHEQPQLPMPFANVSSESLVPEETLHVAEQEDAPPNGGYGWVCCASVFMINAHTWGINSAYGVFLAYYLSTNTFPSATPLQYAFIGGLSISQALIVSPLTTYTNNRYGLKSTLLIGLALQTIALIGASFANQVWHLFLTQGLCFGWGMGFLYVGSAAVVPRWFSTRRSLATGITSSGAGFGGLAYNLAANSLIEKIGLSWTLRALALCQIVVNAICIVLLKERPAPVQAKGLAFDWRLFRRGPIWLILGWGFFSELGYVVLYYSMPDYATSVGLSSSQGAIVGAMLSLGLGVGRPLVGWVSDEIGRLNIASAMTALCGVFCLLIWVFAKSFGVLCFFALVAGTVCGTYWSTVVPVCGEVVGMKDLPNALSIAFMMMMFPTTFAEPIALQLRRKSGNAYLPVQIFTGCMFLLAAMCSWGTRTWKINEEKHRQDCRQYREDGRQAPLDERDSYGAKLYRYTLSVFSKGKV